MKRVLSVNTGIPPSRVGMLLTVLIAAALAAGTGCGRNGSSTAGSDRLVTVESGGIERSCRLHLPASYSDNAPAPLLFALHGGGGDGAGMERLTHLSEVADRQGFIVAYPDGVNRGWNDGRPEINPGIDDVGFFRDLLSDLEARFAIDSTRVYSTGISNGGFMSLRLAFDMPERIAAIAPVAAQMTDVLVSRTPPPLPTPVVFVLGVDDPLVPWDGGDIAGGRRGTVISAEDTVAWWAAHDGCAPEPSVTELPDADPDDGTLVAREEYAGGRDGSGVALYRVEGGGHTWPGGRQYLRERFIGRTSRDFDAGEAIWEFCSRFSR